MSDERDFSDEPAEDLGPVSIDIPHIPLEAMKTAPGGPRFEEHMSVGLALSGGGHRASLFSLGSLMALADVGKSPLHISSVSGGSITNAFLALRYFGKGHDLAGAFDRNEWEEATQACFDAITRRGVLTRPWLVAMVLILAVPPLLFVGLALAGRLPSPLVTVSLAAAWGCVIFLRGLVIDWLFGRVYFEGPPAPRLGGSSSPVEHVLCCTDLVSGRPFYASTREGGTLFQRVGEPSSGGWVPGRSPHATDEGPPGNNFDGSGMTWASLVRASAGFPGIPPRRCRLKMSEGESHLSFLSDGGIWNNLATQPFEDRYLWRGGEGPWVVLVVDASARLEGMSSWKLHLPLIGEIIGLVRQIIVQNFNTVVPRRSIYEREELTEALFPGDARFRVTRLYPVVALGDSPRDILARFSDGAAQEDPYSHTYEEGHRERREAQRKELLARCEGVEDSGEYRQLENLANRAGDVSAEDVETYPTTLDRVRRSVALGITARGYVNTILTLYLTGLVEKLVLPSGWLGELLRDDGR